MSTCRIRTSSRSSILARIPSDRKSTRLNSSHSQISYAVFCLKKKNAQVLTVRHQLYAAGYSLARTLHFLPQIWSPRYVDHRVECDASVRRVVLRLSIEVFVWN